MVQIYKGHGTNKQDPKMHESHYTVWTAWISIRVRVRLGIGPFLDPHARRPK